MNASNAGTTTGTTTGTATATATATTAWIDRIGLIGPGLPDWATARAVLTGVTSYAPAPTAVTLPPILPPAERRRTSLAVRVALAAGHQALADADVPAAELASVFASSGGDGVTCHLICEALAGADRRVSPTQFHNSVHNAPSGYWSIAMHATAASTSLCAYDGSFAAGLLDAVALLADTGRPVLLVAYDAPYPAPLAACRPIADAFGLALLLAAEPPRPDACRLALRLATGTPTPLADPALDALRQTIPTARALPMLARIAAADTGAPTDTGPVYLEYLPPIDDRSASTCVVVELGSPVR